MVILGCGGGVPGDHCLRVVVEGDGICCASSVGRVGQHAVAFVVVEIVRAAYRAGRRAPGGQLAPAIVAHQRAGRTAARAGVGGAGVGVATGHVPHRIVGGILVGDGAQPRDGVDLVGVGIAVDTR